MKQELLTKLNEARTGVDITPVLGIIVNVAVLFIAFVIIATIFYLFLAIFKISKAGDDQEERAEKIKHTIVIGVCLVVEIVIIVLLSMLF